MYLLTSNTCILANSCVKDPLESLLDHEYANSYRLNVFFEADQLNNKSVTQWKGRYTNEDFYLMISFVSCLYYQLNFVRLIDFSFSSFITELDTDGDFFLEHHSTMKVSSVQWQSKSLYLLVLDSNRIFSRSRLQNSLIAKIAECLVIKKPLRFYIESTQTKWQST